MINYNKLKDEVKNIINESFFNVSISFCDLDNGEHFSVEGDKRMQSASMIKLLIMLTLLKKVEEGEISLDEKIKLEKEKRVEGSGILKELSYDHLFSIRELLTLMIIISDNFATNILIGKIGMDEINRTAKDFGLKKTILQRNMMDLDAKERGLDNYTSSDDILKILKSIYEKNFLGEDMSKLAIDILLKQQERDRLQRYLKEDLKIANKTGDLDNLENDGGIFFTENKNYILVVLVNQAKSNILAKELIGKISLKIYNSIGV
ncbi:serine hydrolase [Peptoniphilus porci]|uniref:Serine hydrolase n=1 Tax=Peptoniphilus porci TaxID=2652280 RepID=A0A1U7LZN2_9FIRM|nr:serine hydrolase [Peptoniphilus porci]OLR64756.1 serine hydrolase [Peptoniphilus porci]